MESGRKRKAKEIEEEEEEEEEDREPQVPKGLASVDGPSSAVTFTGHSASTVRSDFALAIRSGDKAQALKSAFSLANLESVFPGSKDAESVCDEFFLDAFFECVVYVVGLANWTLVTEVAKYAMARRSERDPETLARLVSTAATCPKSSFVEVCSVAFSPEGKVGRDALGFKTDFVQDVETAMSQGKMYSVLQTILSPAATPILIESALEKALSLIGRLEGWPEQVEEGAKVLRDARKRLDGEKDRSRLRRGIAILVVLAPFYKPETAALETSVGEATLDALRRNSGAVFREYNLRIPESRRASFLSCPNSDARYSDTGLTRICALVAASK